MNSASRSYLAGREAVLAASVIAEFDQIGRATHRAHDLFELVDLSLCRCANFAMSRCVKVDCCRVIASSAAEGSAMIRAPLPRAISRCAIGFEPFAFDAPNLDPFSGRADLALRLECDALCF